MTLPQLKSHPGFLDAWRRQVSQSCPFVEPRCDPSVIYRTADGSCNNLNHSSVGAAYTRQRRMMDNSYEDGLLLLLVYFVNAPPPHPPPTPRQRRIMGKSYEDGFYVVVCCCGVFFWWCPLTPANERWWTNNSLPKLENSLYMYYDITKDGSTNDKLASKGLWINNLPDQSYKWQFTNDHKKLSNTQ